MKGFLTLVEASWLSVWVRESLSLLAFPTILALHAIGMGFLVGASIAMDLRVFGFAPRIPLSVMKTLFPIMLFGFCMNAVSGVLLLLAYPTKALTNPLFYAKLGLIGIALVVTVVIRKRILSQPRFAEMPVTTKGKMLAGASLALWAAAIIAGRLLAYTYNYMTAFEL